MCPYLRYMTSLVIVRGSCSYFADTSECCGSDAIAAFTNGLITS